MTQNTVDVSDENVRYDEKANIQQIVLHEELIYIFKFFAFIIIAVTVFIIPADLPNKGLQDFYGVFTFGLTTAIDSAVLAKTFKVKGKINNILITYIVLLFLSVTFILFIFLGKLPISAFSIYVCDFISIFCCLSPILEMIYDIISHVQKERIENY